MHAPDKLLRILVLVVALALTLVYTFTVAPALYSDDWAFFSRAENETLGPLLSGQWIALDADYYRPLATASLLSDIAVFGYAPRELHWVQLGIFYLCVIAAGRLAGCLAGRNAGTAAAATMLLGLLHPATVESVAWLSCRPNLLSCLFGLLASLATVRHARSGRVGHLPLIGLTLLLALFSKEDALVLVPAVLLLGCTRGGRTRLLRLVVVVGGAALAYFAARLAAGVGWPAGVHARLLDCGVVEVFHDLSRQLGLVLLPRLETTSPVVSGIQAVSLATLAALGWRAWRRRPTLLLAVVVILGCVPALPLLVSLAAGVRILFLAILFSAALLGLLVAAVRGPAWLRLAAAVVPATGFALVLPATLDRWTESSRLAGGIAQELLALHDRVPPGERFVFVDPPISCRGAATFDYNLSYLLQRPFTPRPRLLVSVREPTFLEADRLGVVEPAGPWRALAWHPVHGLRHAPLPASSADVLRSFSAAELKMWPSTTTSAGLQLTSPEIGLSALVVDRLEVDLDRAACLPAFLTVMTPLAPAGLRLPAIRTKRGLTFALRGLAFATPVEPIGRLVLTLGGVAPGDVRAVRLRRFTPRFDAEPELVRSGNRVLFTLRFRRVERRWEAFRVIFGFEQIRLAEFVLPFSALKPAEGGGFVLRHAFTEDYLRTIGVQAGMHLYLQVEALGTGKFVVARSLGAGFTVP